MLEKKTPLHGLRKGWHWLRTADGPLGRRAARGGVWLVAADLANRLVSLIRMVLLSRLLAPADFGLLGVALMFQMWIEAFAQTGLQASLVQHRGDIRPMLDSVWTASILRGAAVSALMAASAPLAASFFEDPKVTAVLMATGLVPLVGGFESPQVAALKRDLDFQREVMYKGWGTVAGFATAVVLGLALRNVWALVASLIASRLGEVAGSYWAKPYRPRFRLDLAQIRQLFRFGRWVFWANALSQIQRQVDSLFIGKLLGTHDLGSYQVGRQLTRTPMTMFGVQVANVSFPAFSQATQARVGVGFTQISRALAAGVIPAVVGFSLYSRPIVSTLLGDQWGSVPPIAAWLAWAGLLELLGAPARAASMARGLPNLLLAPSVVRLVVTVVGMYLLLPSLGAEGAACATLAAAVIWYGILLSSLVRESVISTRQILRLPGPGMLASTPLLLVWALAPAELSMAGTTLWVGFTGMSALAGVWICREDWLPYLTSRATHGDPARASQAYD